MSSTPSQPAATPSAACGANIWKQVPIAGVKRLIAVASGKGGVGKSTTTVGIAMALAAAGKRVGILDADIYGPSIPRMMGLSGRPEVKDKKLVPMNSHGIQCMSIGLIAGDDNSALVWRGPMVTKALTQMLRDVAWDRLDVLLIDMPPGTGDIHLTLAQSTPLDGAIIVTTPQGVATLDARKCLDMFRKVNVPVLGVVENMSYFDDPASGNRSYIFGEGGGKRLAEECGVSFLGEVPLTPDLRAAMDAGTPTDQPAYRSIAEALR